MNETDDSFIDVSFLENFPPQSTAAHEVYMSFRHDADAEAFRDWWDESGAKLFGTFLREKNK